MHFLERNVLSKNIHRNTIRLQCNLIESKRTSKIIRGYLHREATNLLSLIVIDVESSGASVSSGEIFHELKENKRTNDSPIREPMQIKTLLRHSIDVK